MGSIRRLQFVKSDIDRHGNVRHYVRKRGCKLVRLPGLFGSEEFMQAYAAALSATPRVEIAARRTRAGSISAMIIGYLGSAAFSNLAPASQLKYRRILEGMRQAYGDMPVATLQRKHVVKMLDAKADTPVAARDFLVCLRLIVQYALGIGVRQDDPTAGVRVKMPHSDGYHSWTEEEITTFRDAYPVGSKPRLALELLLGTALRCVDVVKLGRGHVCNGTLTVPVTQKTKAPLVVPVSSELATALNAAAPADSMLFLLNEYGRPFTARAFSKWFCKHCARVGLTGVSAHGLRKAAARRLAEAGCTAPEIAAITGHRSLREVQRYIDAADRVKLAHNAMDKARKAT